MYSIDLSEISIEDFAKTIVTVELLPSRKVLADHIERIVPALRQLGVDDLAVLKKRLADKQSFPDLGAQLGVDVDWLTLLNREVNSYVSRPVPLAKLDYLSEPELPGLRARGIKTTKDLYEQAAARADRSDLAIDAAMSAERLDHVLRLANLVRVNGVGPAFAVFLVDAGVEGPSDFLHRDVSVMADDYNRNIEDGAPKLRVEDLEFVQRYCRSLPEDIEW